MTVPSATAQIGVTGLAVMGSNIARNFARNGYTVAVHNRSIAKTDALLAEHGGDGDFVRTETMAEFAAALERPRRALIMVQAGDATDAVIEEIAAVFEPGDIIIDGGNALYTDTIRREASLADRGLLFIGAGISGGEEGALLGPSIMPGGPAKSYEAVGPMLEKVAAQVDETDGTADACRLDRDRGRGDGGAGAALGRPERDEHASLPVRGAPTARTTSGKQVGKFGDSTWHH